MAIEFTREEISTIEKNLGFIVFDWAKHLVNNVISQARDAQVNVVYINTEETLNAGGITDPKTQYFYSKLPQILGFKKEQVDLRGKGAETLWAYHLNRVTASSNLFKIAKKFALEQIPRKYQGAFISIIGRKPFYSEEEFQKVLGILEKKEKKPKSIPKFYYDWTSKTWTGGQRFSSDVTENVVMQKITSEMQDFIQNEPALLKFWAFLLSQSGHFGSDVIGFALVSKVSQEAWVINEIQTDAINAYMQIRRLNKDTKRNETITLETLIDMLQAQNRSKWIPKIEMNEAFANQLMQSPNIIQQLPDDSQDIDAWINEQMAQQEAGGATQGLDLIQHFQSVNFNSRIFRIY